MNKAKRHIVGLIVLLFVVCLSSSVYSQEQAGTPAYQAGSWVQSGGPIGGLGYDIRYNFTDHNLWYVTDAWAGIHISTDRGLTWSPSNEGVLASVGLSGEVLPVFSATVDPHNSDIVWIGTQGSGDIYKSTDRGYTWTHKNNGVDPELRPLSFRGFTIDPRSSDIVYAMGEISSPAWTPDRSGRTGFGLDMTQGIVYRTMDGGETWTQIWRGDNLARYLWVNPHDTNILYVSTGIFDREAANSDVDSGFAGGVGVLKSTDGGETWRELNQENGLTDLYVGSLYMHPENPEMLLAAASQDSWSGYSGEWTGGVFLTEDGGENWEKVLSEPELYSAVEYCTADSSVAYAASLTAVYRSEDAGHTWQRFERGDGTWGPAGVIAGFPIDIQCDPDNPMRVFINNYLGGNFLSEDGGQTWVSASAGYTGALIHHVVIAPGNPQTVFAGSRTGVFRNDNGGDGEWTGISAVVEVREVAETGEMPPVAAIRMNEITALAVDPTNADHLLAAPWDFPSVAYSYDGGQSWQSTRLPDSLVHARDIIVIPSDPMLVYAAVAPPSCWMPEPGRDMEECRWPGQGLYVSRDGGETWTSPVSEQPIGTIVIHPDDANIIWGGTPAIGVVKTTDGGQTWTSGNPELSNLPVRDIVIDRTHPEILFAGTNGGGIYRSIDGGLSWAQLSVGMEPNADVRSLAIDPTNGQIIYAGTAFDGVMVSTDGGESWQILNQGMGQRSVNALAISEDGSVLYAGVEGAGVYRLGTP